MRLKERGLFVGFLFLIIMGLVMFTPEVSAQNTCSNSSQIILKLSNLSNAHGEWWDGTNYLQEVCYDSIFGVTYGGTNPHDCTGTNNVVDLSGITNAHGEATDQGNYATDVCYGDLSCVQRTGACQGNEQLVLSLSSETNAHLAGDDSYPVNICCSIGVSACTLTDSSWSVSETVEGTSVDLTVEGNNCNGETVSLEIGETDCLIGTCDYGDLDTEDTDELSVSNVSGSFSGTQAVISWTSEWVKDDNNGLFGDDDPEYVFQTTLDSNPSMIIDNSGELKVTPLPPRYCLSVNICEDYYTGLGLVAEDSCNADLCDVAEFSVESINADSSFCEDGDISCLCEWNLLTVSCDSTWSGNSTGLCGNDVLDNGEVCDGTNLAGFSCSDFDNLTGTTLLCNSECSGFITSSCTGYSCNDDGVLDNGEACDGANLGGYSCTDFDNFTGGTLGCNSVCDLDTSLCSGGGSSGGFKVGKCTYDEESTDTCADDGFLTFSWTASWTWAEGNEILQNDPANLSSQCVSGQRTVECSAQIPLPFFGFYNVVIALLAIGMIYGIISLRKKRINLGHSK